MNRPTSVVKVWFDSQCPLCSKEIAVMKRLDWRARGDFIDIYASADCPLDPSRLLERFNAQETRGPILDGAAAFAVLWRHLPLLRLLGELARIPVCLKALECACIKFLRFRPRLQQLLG